MKAFLDLAVLGIPEALKKFLPLVESLLPPSAYRDREIEDRIKERFPDSRRCDIRWRRFSDDLIFPIEQNPEAICFGEVFLYPGKMVVDPTLTRSQTHCRIMKRRLTTAGKRSRTDVKCPRCQSAKVIPTIYGLPGEELLERVAQGELRLGGCCIGPNQPRSVCQNCGATW